MKFKFFTLYIILFLSADFAQAQRQDWRNVPDKFNEQCKQSFIEKVQSVINDDDKKNYNSYKKGLDAK